MMALSVRRTDRERADRHRPERIATNRSAFSLRACAFWVLVGLVAMNVTTPARANCVNELDNEFFKACGRGTKSCWLTEWGFTNSDKRGYCRCPDSQAARIS
jgi:hypothetical protein